MTLPERARALAEKLAPLHQWLHDGTPWHNGSPWPKPGSTIELAILAALEATRREALEDGARAASLEIVSLIRALLDASDKAKPASLCD